MQEQTFELRDILRNVFDNTPQSTPYIETLDLLWNDLKENVYAYTDGRYPAGHGVRHIQMVIQLLTQLLVPYLEIHFFSPQDIYFLMAAALFHDAGMLFVISKGAYGSDAEAARRNHPKLQVVTNAVRESFSRCGTDEFREEIPLAIAWAHASDDQLTADKKLQTTAEHLSQKLEYQPIIILSCLLRLADYLDIGHDRLIKPYQQIQWSDEQTEHVRKHETLKVEISGNIHKIAIRTVAVPTLAKDHCFALLRQVHDYTSRLIANLNKLSKISWTLRELDEGMFGKIYPAVYGGDLFNNIFNESLESRTGRFEIDIMGHSLYGRFVDDKEGINIQLLKLLESGDLILRVLILDPLIENQQMKEVLEAQYFTEAKNRSILPIPNLEGGFDDETGDISATLKKLKNEWAERIGVGSLLEVRLPHG